MLSEPSKLHKRKVRILLPSAFSMPKPVRDGRFRGWWTELLIAAIDPAIGSVAIEPAVESACGKHDEGTVLSARTLEAV